MDLILFFQAFKENFLDNVKVRRLPSAVLAELDDTKGYQKKPNATNAHRVIATTDFNVEGVRKIRNKPSEYLEESIHIDSLYKKTNKEAKISKPKVLPTLPTASTSSFGFTTNFKINVLQTNFDSITQSNVLSNFRNAQLYGKRIKRLNFQEKCKKLRNIKLAKF